MKPASLVLVLVAAKVMGLAGRDLPASPWLVSVLVWDDVAVGAVLWAVHRSVRRPVVTSAAYWIVVLWTVLNVPVVRALSSPLTVNMLRAADGALRDSAAHYATAGNLIAIGLLLLLAARLPAWLERVPARVTAGASAAAILIALPGPVIERRLDTHGAHRSAITAVVRTALPRVEGRALAGDWRASPFGDAEATDLRAWRGAGTGRHVVLIVLESTAAQYLRAYGAADDPTPNLTAWTRAALRFERTYTVYPESIKGLFALLCARAPAFDVDARTHAGAACTPLARVLTGAGYRTALFHSGRFDYLGMDEVVARQGFDVREDAGAIGGQVESSFGVDEASTVRRMLAWVDSLEPERPFFITYLPVAGHHPYATAVRGPFPGATDFSAYQNALYEGDQSLGLLMNGLRRRDLEHRTVFVVVGDHGEAFGQHDGNFGHTLAIHDENVRVPLFVLVPGAPLRGMPVPDVASTIDVAPTILDLLGLEVPAAYEGRSLLQPHARMALFYTDYSRGLLGLQDRCWKYQLDIDAGQSRLFDTCVDPGETNDRSASAPERVRAYGERVRAWTSATREAIESGR